MNILSFSEQSHNPLDIDQTDIQLHMDPYPLVSLRKGENVAELGRGDIALHHIFGADLTRVANLSFIEDDVIIYISGNAVIFENIGTGSKDYLLGIDEIGVGAVAVHPTRTKFAVGGKGYQPNVYIYEYPSLQICKVLRAGTERSYASLSFTEEGDKIATVGGLPDYMLTVWNWQEERIILHCKAFGQDVFSVRFSQDDERRLTTSGTGHIRFWKMVATFTGQKLQGNIGKFGKIELSDISAFAELPDGKVVSGTETGDLLLWEGNFIKCRFINDNGSKCHSGNVNHVVLDREAGCVISAGADGHIRWWSFSLIDSAEVDSDVTMDFKLTPVNEFYLGEGCGVKYFISNEVNGEARFVLLDTSGKLSCIRYNVATCKVRGIPKDASVDILGYFAAGAITGLDTNPIQHLAITSGKDGFVRLWDYINRSMLCFRKFPSAALCVSWVPVSVDRTCRLAAVGFEDGVVRVLNVFRREGADADEGSYEMYKQMLFKPHNCSIVVLSFSPDGKIFCTAGADGTVFFFDTTVLTYENCWSALRFIQLPAKVVCERFAWRKTGELICSCSDGIGRIVDLAMLRRLVGMESSALEITTYEVTLPIKEVNLTFEVKSATGPAAATKAISVDSADGSGELASAVAAPPSPDKATATVTMVPVKINNIYESASGALFAGATYGQTHCFISIHEDLSKFTELPMGLHSKDGKGALKPPAVTSVSHCRSRNFMLVGARDGSVVVRAEEYAETFARVLAHNEHVGGVTAVSASFDDTFLVSAGLDGILAVHRMRPSRILEAAEPLAKDIRAGVYDTQTEKERPKVPVVELKHLFKVNPYVELEGFGPLPVRLCEDDDFIENMTAAPIPEGREAAELEPGTYSIQDAKLKSEDDARKLTADDKKENVRKLVRQLQREYADLLEKVRKFPEKVRIPERELLVDEAYFGQLAKEEEAAVAEAHRDCEYQAAVSSAFRKKLTDRLMDRVVVEDITLKGFRTKNTPIVHSLRTRDLDPSVRASLESIRGMVRDEEMEASRARAVQASIGEQMKAVAAQGSVSGNTTASTNGADGHGHTGVAESIDGSSQHQNANLNSTRSDLRKQRKEELRKHGGSKPREDEDDVRDVEAINLAEKTIGSYKLKIADDYQVPEHQRVNAEKKKRQIVMLEDSVLSLKTQFNDRFLALRSLKKKIIDDVNQDHNRLNEIDAELDQDVIPASTIVPRSNDPSEYPDDRDEVTEKELEHYKAIAKEKSFDKIVPMPHSIITGTKTVLDGSIRSRVSSSPTKFSRTLTSQFQSFVDANSSVGITNSGNYDGSSKATKPAADQFLSKYYPEDEGLDDLESSVAVLVAAKENIGQVNKSRKEPKSFLTADRQRLLLHERALLVKKTERNLEIFDEAVDELRVERHALIVNLKQAELKLLVLFQEYMQLLTFETRDNALQAKHAKCMREKSEIISGTLDLHGKMEVKMDELKSWNEKAEQVLASFHQLVPSSYPFADQLMKIFKKKIKRNKHSVGGENGEEEEFEEEEDDSDEDDDDLDDEEVEDACPTGCDMVIYDKVLDLREKRLDIDEVTSDVIKIVEDLKKSADRLKTREKQIDKDAKMTESEIQQFQLQKQLALNQIDVYLPVNLSQVYAFTTSGDLSGPGQEKAEVGIPDADGNYAPAPINDSVSKERVLIADMTSKSHVLMKSSSLQKVQQRIGELHSEIDTAKQDLRRLHKEKSAFSKQREAQKSKIGIWQEKVDELMSMKFGRVIDLDELEKGSDRTVEDFAQKDLEQQEQKAEAELRKLAAEAFELKTKIVEATETNTLLLQKVADLAASKLALTRELNTPTGSHASATQGVGLDETSDRAELKQFSLMQLREIDALRNEITSLRRKDAPLLLSSTMPNPMSRSTSARNQDIGSRGLFPPIPSAQRSNISR